MQDEPPDLNRILVSYLSQLRDGCAPDRDQLFADYPDQAEALRQVLATLDASDQTMSFAVGDETIYSAAVSRGTAHESFGDYEILEEIARGGMGVVYKARQRSLNRIVAIKMILSGGLASTDDVRRFQAEAEAAAGLDHTGIVPIYEVGQWNGQHYFSMAYLEGESLAQRVQRGPLPIMEAVAMAKQVAEALAFAHDHGVIHRDLKPSNVLLDSEGRAKLTDFGLAKLVESDGQITATGQILGTPNYMPPEQAGGKSNQVGPASDIYAVGAVLYCLVCGQPPFQAASVMDTLVQVLEQDPVPLRLRNAKVPHDVDAICQKCLAKNPRDRYASAHALAADLGRVLAGEPASVSSARWHSGVLRALQRNRDDVHLQAWSSVLALLAMIVCATEVTIQWMNRTGPMTPFMMVRSAQAAAIAVVAIVYRQAVFGRHPAVVQIRNLSLGFLAACWLDVAVAVEQHIVLGSVAPLRYYGSYPTFLILSGLFFLALARQYWGMCYAFCSLFFTFALIVPWFDAWAPTLFGMAWTSALLLVSRRLRGMQSEQEPSAGEADTEVRGVM